MERSALEEALLREIPMSDAMGAGIVEAAPSGVLLTAPLAPNVNHRATAFGGSVAALAMLAGWLLVEVRLGDAGLHAHTVVQTSEVRFLAPARGALEARAAPPDDQDWSRFARTLQRRGRARVRLRAEVHSAGALVAVLEAAYVSIAEDR
jgi:thioesterase domain-containing protein